jgi:hypothetical protein
MWLDFQATRRTSEDVPDAGFDASGAAHPLGLGRAHIRMRAGALAENGEPQALHKLLVDNPTRLYWYD